MHRLYAPVTVIAPLALSLSFAASGARAAATGPAHGAYSFTGTVATTTPTGGALCPVAGQAVSGDAYISKNLQEFKGHFLTSGTIQAWGWSIGPSTPPISLFTFGVNDTGPLHYGKVPLLDSLPPGQYAERAKAGPDATRFSLEFYALTGPLGVGTAGTCTVYYLLNFTIGVAPRVLNFLNGIL